MTEYRRGSVVLVRLDPVVGSEQGKTRPCVVVQNDVANRVSRTVTVVPVVGFADKIASYPVCVPVDAGEAGLRKRSIVNCAHVRTVDASRLVLPPLGDVASPRMRAVDRAIRIHLGL
ncbi:MAG: type II toxin-antitoxin system PemK/MazF family toxin [Deltaproteobacteria bacterium]|nr:type II toxin-antitoxin system PemK/MazF family toxin [Deltaproteobacteria bacterium]